MYQRILVPVDGSDTSKLALQHAVKFATDQRAQIKIVHVVAHLAALGAEGHFSLDQFFRKNGMYLGNAAAAIVREGGIAAETALLEGLRPSAVIVEDSPQGGSSQRSHPYKGAHAKRLRLFAYASRFRPPRATT